MYNLLMHSWAGRWDDPSTSFELDRFLEHTHEAIAAKFRSLGDSEVAALKNLPALFCYERGVQDVARVGRITAVQRGSQGLTLTWEFDPAVPPIQPQTFQSLHGVLLQGWAEAAWPPRPARRAPGLYTMTDPSADRERPRLYHGRGGAKVHGQANARA